MPWSVCGCKLGKALYMGDSSARMQSEYQNLPILEPLDGMRAFFGEPTTFAQTYSGRGDIRYKYSVEWMFDRHDLPSDLAPALSVGADVDFPSY